MLSYKFKESFVGYRYKKSCLNRKLQMLEN